MKVNLAYGQGYLPVEFPKDRTTVIAPNHSAGLKDEHAAILNALENPIGSKPLKELIKPGDKICISFTDITRATPNDRIIPWLLQHLSHVPRENITLLNVPAYSTRPAVSMPCSAASGRPSKRYSLAFSSSRIQLP